MRVLDYSAGFPGAKAIKDAGYAGAVRYIGTPGNRKCTTKAELEDFDRHGLGMALVFEQTAGQWRNGFEQGRRDAKLARDHADAIGWPRGRPIYMAIDQDVVTEAEYAAMGRYLDGAGEVLGRELTGPYGEYEVCRRSAEWGFPWQWQCRAWSGIAVISHFNGRRLYQYFGHPNGGPNPTIGGVECDVNEVENDDWGQHNFGGDNMSAAAEENIKQVAKVLGDAYEVRDGQEITAGTRLKGLDTAIGRAYDPKTDTTLGDRVKTIEADVKALRISGVPVDVRLSAEDREDLAQRIVELQDQRARDNDPKTGPVS